MYGVLRVMYTAVYNMQGQCNSSYAFSAIGALEGASALITGEPIPFSEQNILDCTGILL